MKFALYGGERVEAEANLKDALCPVCDTVVIARCGDKNIHHWAHKRKIESLVLSEIIKTRRGRRTFASVRKRGY